MITDIVITSYNRRDFTKKCVQSVLDNTPAGTYRMIVVDNGSSDGTRDWLLDTIKAPHIVVALNQNLGLQQAKNVGMTLVKSPRFFSCDDDIIVPRDTKAGPMTWMSEMHRLMDENPKFSAISMRPQILVGVGALFRDKPEVVENNVAGGSMRLMDTEAVRSVGAWAKDFENRREEWHISDALRAKGRLVGYARDGWCYHLFGDKVDAGNRWGYVGGVEHYHRTDTTEYHDGMFPHDPLTLVPLKRHNG